MVKKLFSIALIYIAVLCLAVPAAAAGTLILSASSASVGATVTVSGISAPDSWVAVKVLDGSGNIIFYDNAKSDMSGAYSCTFKVPDGTDGSLKVVAGYGSNVASASLNVPQLPANSAAVTVPTYTADVSGTGITSAVLPVVVDQNRGRAALNIDSLLGNVITGGGSVVITVPSIPGVNAYTLGIPVAYLSMPEGKGVLTFNSNMGSVSLPASMLAAITGGEGKKAEITVGNGDKSGLSEAVKAAIGNRPLIQLAVTIDGKQIEWNNPNAPVTISIPYTPTAEELKNSESIVIWYIDGSANVVTIPNGCYDPTTGTVTFTTTHFSDYAVAYNKASFNDVAEGAWYNKAVSFIAAREITTGTGNGNYSPDAKLTRGQFIVMLLKTYDIAPDTNAKDNFTDAGNTYYTGYLAAAKRLGISGGVGNNLFAPGRQITRQEMFTLLYNALNIIGRLPEGKEGKDLTAFNDAGDIASWAKDAMTFLVETGSIGGNAGKLTPTSTTTRAEMAQVLYNLLSK